MSVGINPPKTPITKGSNGVATATLPNVCKMPGPPAPFVPTPLPNIGRSGDKPKKYTKKVLVKGKAVAVRGASFGSMGDMASKGTGGGIISANTHGPCKFISPGSMDVKFEGKNVHLLGDMVTNNGAGSGTPANSATMMGTVQTPAAGVSKPCPKHEPGGEPSCPETDESFRDRRNALAKKDKHEHAAAVHNEKEILDMEGDLRREGERRSALTVDNEHQVTHTCKHCGAPLDAEIDHLAKYGDRKHAVEAKSGEDFYPAKSDDELLRNVRQMERYKSLANSSGYGITYKIPGDHKKAERQIYQLAEKLGIPRNIIQVIRI